MNNPFVQQAELQVLRGAPVEALKAARMGLLLFPDSTELLTVAAHCAGLLGDGAFAVECWRRLLDLEPSNGEAGNCLGLLLGQLQRPEEAEAVFRRALQTRPDDARLHANLGLLLENRRRFAEAEGHLEQARALAPDSPEILANLAGLLARLARDDEAEALYRAALALDPASATAHSNLGVLLSTLGREAEAETAFRAALGLQPDKFQARSNLAQLLLALGCYEEGWPLHEVRRELYSGGPGFPPSCPEWRGEPLAGKRILVLPEQGFGDALQFCRYLPWLKARGAARVTLVCRPELKALLATLAGVDALFGLDEAAPHLGGHDYWCFLLSLPLHAGTTIGTIPAAVPYLAPEPARLARLAPYLAGKGLKVGVVWRGNPGHSNDSERSLPGLEALAPLWAVDGLRFFGLQKSPLPLPPPPPGQPLVDLAPAIGDFADTAAALVQLDLLIAVDTSTAHLAGALGVPCWVLLPRYKTDWRWLLGRADSPWYPSLRLFRQARRGDWAAPVAELAGALAEWRGRRAGR